MDLVKLEKVDFLDSEVVLSLKLKEVLTIYAVLGVMDAPHIAHQVSSSKNEMESNTGLDFSKVIKELKEDQLGYIIYSELASVIDDIVADLT